MHLSFCSALETFALIKFGFYHRKMFYKNVIYFIDSSEKMFQKKTAIMLPSQTTANKTEITDTFRRQCVVKRMKPNIG